MSKKNSMFLEVDSSVFEKNLLIKNDENEANDFESILNKLNTTCDEEPWKLVTPSPGLVIKTWDSKGNKVFVNLCKTDEIPEPGDLTEAELTTLWQSDEITDYRVPLSLMDPHDELDKSGKEAVVYDVAVNSKFFDKIKENEVFRSFAIQLVHDGLENKYNIELKKAYVILKNRTCIGDLKPHRIRTNKEPYEPPKRLIEETSFLSNKDQLESQKQLKNSRQNCSYRLLNSSNILLGQFYLPNIKLCREIRLDVGLNRIILESKNNSLDLFLPCNVDECKTTALFNQTNKILTVFMPRLIST